MAEPASWTFRPLRTPPVPLLVEPRFDPPDPNCVEARTPLVADEGPCEMLLDTFRNREPALARSRLASESLGVYRADSRSRLFSSASAMASRSDRYMLPARIS